MPLDPKLSLEYHDTDTGMVKLARMNDHRRFGRLYRYYSYVIARQFPLHTLHLRQDVAEKNDHFFPIALDGLANPHHGEKILSSKFYCQNPHPIDLYRFISHPNPEGHMRRAGLSAAAIHQLQSFDWLADVHAYAQSTPVQTEPTNLLNAESHRDRACRFCRDFVQAWITQHQRYSSMSWHLPTLARRINNWLYYYKSLFHPWSGNEDIALMRSITMQLHHLRLCVINETRGTERIFALICWVNTGLCLDSERAYLEEGKALLGAELQQQLADSDSALLQSPFLVHKLLFQLQNLNRIFLHAGLDVPFILAAAELRLAILLRHYQFRTQKRLACFYGRHAHIPDIPTDASQFTRQRLVSTHQKFLEHSDELPLKRIDHHGFTLFMDGAHRRGVRYIPFVRSLPHHAQNQQYCSALAIELADGEHMLFVNAMPPHPKNFAQRNPKIDWYAADKYSGLFIEYHGAYKPAPHAEYRVECQLVRDQQQVWLQAWHDGVGKSRKLSGTKLSGTRLSRTLYFGPDTIADRVIRGMDELHISASQRATGEVTLVSQFHLHPDIEVTPLKGGSMLLRARKKQASWIFSSPYQTHISLLHTFYSAECGQYNTGVTPESAQSSEGAQSTLQTLRLSRSIALEEHAQSNEPICLQWELQAK